MTEILIFTDVSNVLGYGKAAGAYKIATDLRRNGFSCQVVDCYSSLTKNQIEEIIDRFVDRETLFVGFSCSLLEKRINKITAARFDQGIRFFGQEDSVFFHTVNKIKQVNKNTKIVLGGAMSRKGPGWNSVDFVVTGKADNSIIALSNHLKKGTPIKYKKMGGTLLIDSNDYFYSSEEFSESKIIYEENDIIFKKEVLPMEISRGCIFSCAFCVFDLIGKKKGDWTKTSEIIKEEMIRNYELYGVTDYSFSDEILNETLEKTLRLHKIFTSLPFQPRFTSYARLDLIWRYPEMRELLLEAGAQSLNFGIETMHDEAGKITGKGLGEKRTRNTLEYCKELWRDRVMITTGLIIGLPGEEEESIRRTFEWLIPYDSPVDSFQFIPLGIERNRSAEEKLLAYPSKMSKNPADYGYELTSDGGWISSLMTSERADALGAELAQEKNIRREALHNGGLAAGRLLNLGYSIKNIIGFSRGPVADTESLKQEITKKVIQKRAKYFGRINTL